MTDERVDLVDESNRVVGQASRREVRSQNLLHRGVGVLVQNSLGQVYVHRRTLTKDVFPGLYDMFVGGVVESGESYDSAARREVEEELGIPDSDPEFLFEHLYQGPRNRSFIRVYRVRWDGAVRHQETEIEWGEWLDHDRLRGWAREVEVVPDGLEVFHRYLAWLEGS
ncbi:MAG: NUDIX domain-containing protein [Candidatus Eremiobacterota bacterium]